MQHKEIQRIRMYFILYGPQLISLFTHNFLTFNEDTEKLFKVLAELWKWQSMSIIFI